MIGNVFLRDPSIIDLQRPNGPNVLCMCGSVGHLWSDCSSVAPKRSNSTNSNEMWRKAARKAIKTNKKGGNYCHLSLDSWLRRWSLPSSHRRNYYYCRSPDIFACLSDLCCLNCRLKKLKKEQNIICKYKKKGKGKRVGHVRPLTASLVSSLPFYFCFDWFLTVDTLPAEAKEANRNHNNNKNNNARVEFRQFWKQINEQCRETHTAHSTQHGTTNPANKRTSDRV